MCCVKVLKELTLVYSKGISYNLVAAYIHHMYTLGTHTDKFMIPFYLYSRSFSRSYSLTPCLCAAAAVQDVGDKSQQHHVRRNVSSSHDCSQRDVDDVDTS